MLNHFLHIVLAYCFVVGANAQPDVLARDFEKLSAKERARVAKEEQQAALGDVAYQAKMKEAEELFQQDRYEEAMEKYSEARTMRPYNVYPKVKIQDLQALIAKRDAAAAESKVVTVPVDQPMEARSDLPPVREAPVPTEAAAEVIQEPRPAATPDDRPVNRTAVKSQPKPAGEVRLRQEPTQPPPVLEEGQRVYKEGRAVVVEHRVTSEGRLLIYRKVTHPWGEVNHFRQGIAISGREYEQAMQGR